MIVRARDGFGSDAFEFGSGCLHGGGRAFIGAVNKTAQRCAVCNSSEQYVIIAAFLQERGEA
jgi:hypothetical protein